MEQAKATPPALSIAEPVAPESGLLATWPRCAQTAVAILLALGIGYLLGRNGMADPARRQSDGLPVAEVAHARLDLNRATQAELALLTGLGPARAQSVEDYRRRHGSFRSVEDLRNVPGIGPKTLDKIRASLFVNDVVAAAPPAAMDTQSMSARPMAAPAATSKKKTELTGFVNINSANAVELQELPGVGVKIAQRILDERALRGPFKTVDELRRVPGIGPKTLEKLRPRAVVDAPVAVAGSQ